MQYGFLYLVNMRLFFTKISVDYRPLRIQLNQGQHDNELKGQFGDIGSKNATQTRSQHQVGRLDLLLSGIDKPGENGLL